MSALQLTAPVLDSMMGFITLICILGIGLSMAAAVMVVRQLVRGDNNE